MDTNRIAAKVNKLMTTKTLNGNPLHRINLIDKSIHVNLQTCALDNHLKQYCMVKQLLQAYRITSIYYTLAATQEDDLISF